jgi:peptide/nickel transport system permease protein
MKTLQKNLKELFRYPSAVVGVIIILILVGISIYAVTAIPYSKAVVLWRGGEEVWYQNPKMVPPAWINAFRAEKLPTSFRMNAENTPSAKTVETNSDGSKTITITYTFDYPYDTFPQEMVLYFKSTFVAKNPFASMAWIKPDGKEIQMGNFSVDAATTYRFSQDERLSRRLGGNAPVQGLFTDPNSTEPKALPGTYQLKITALTFEPDADVNAEFVLHGQVYGLAGTDHNRRDLMIALLWGTPIALAFGLLAALGTTVTTMVIAAFGTWYGGWVDGLIQRITGVNMVLPFLPIMIMIGTFYSRSIWLILGATILLSIFGGGIITYRSIFLQIKESPYIEAARAYGARDWRIILRYLTPRIIPMLIPQLVILIPGYVFLEASLAVLGLGDPILPTWGKIINDAQGNGALYAGLYYWVLEPAALLMVTGMAFALLGFALDRIFNPRLRGM